MRHTNTDPSEIWAQSLDTLLVAAWARLQRGVRDKRAAARHVILATRGRNGWPQARIVVLRGADKDASLLEVHTDLRSAKIAELQADPRAMLQAWDLRAHLQIRAEVRAEILSGPQVAARWDRVPEGSRMAYGSTPAPGQPIADALDYIKHPNAQDFAAVNLHVQAFDLVHLGADHRRARFERADGWAGHWLAP
jgi:pyridoxamine 5'-phosphate oxidase